MKSGCPSLASKRRDPRGEFGRRGEDVAAMFFMQRGFTVLSRNWRCRFGELDLVVQRDGEIRFVEVKTRSTHAHGYPEAAVTKIKLRHLQAAAELWFRTRGAGPDKYQFDVLAISCIQGQKPSFHWVQGV